MTAPSTDAGQDGVGQYSITAAKARLSIAAVRARNSGQDRVGVDPNDIAVLLAAHSDLDRALTRPTPSPAAVDEGWRFDMENIPLGEWVQGWRVVNHGDGYPPIFAGKRTGVFGKGHWLIRPGDGHGARISAWRPLPTPPTLTPDSGDAG